MSRPIKAPAKKKNTMPPIITISQLDKTYDDGFKALKDINLDIQKGEIFALLGPNGAGKTTLISAICGIVTPSSGHVTVAGFDILTEYRETRKRIGLVPQELTTDAFETVIATVNFSRGLFGKKPDDAYIEKLLKSLTLWDKRDNALMTLSGGMKRRVLIAKALSHQPEILFLDEPSAGVDVELRKEMWALVRELRQEGSTIILTTHYIEEAEQMADRIGVINKGELILVEDKKSLMQKLGKKQVILDLITPLSEMPPALKEHNLALNDDGTALTYTYDTTAERTGITAVLQTLSDNQIKFRDLNTKESSLEEIFVELVHHK